MRVSRLHMQTIKILQVINIRRRGAGSLEVPCTVINHLLDLEHAFTRTIQSRYNYCSSANASRISLPWTEFFGA